MANIAKHPDVVKQASTEDGLERSASITTDANGDTVVQTENGETFTMTPGADGVPIALFFYPKSGMFMQL